MPSEPESQFIISIPFLIDGEAYTGRDRDMFVAGYEFCQLRTLLHDKPDEPIQKMIHTENDDRLRVLCHRFGRKCEITRFDDDWSEILIHAN